MHHLSKSKRYYFRQLPKLQKQLIKNLDNSIVSKIKIFNILVFRIAEISDEKRNYFMVNVNVPLIWGSFKPCNIYTYIMKTNIQEYKG